MQLLTTILGALSVVAVIAAPQPEGNEKEMFYISPSGQSSRLSKQQRQSLLSSFQSQRRPVAFESSPPVAAEVIAIPDPLDQQDIVSNSNTPPGRLQKRQKLPNGGVVKRVIYYCGANYYKNCAKCFPAKAVYAEDSVGQKIKKCFTGPPCNAIKGRCACEWKLFGRCWKWSGEEIWWTKYAPPPKSEPVPSTLYR